MATKLEKPIVKLIIPKSLIKEQADDFIKAWKAEPSGKLKFIKKRYETTRV